jgi:2-keto-4-pentenoate hydratase/2-oxohepta-3-ene-1,7-dioic acid hydratase in catechol pathway
VRIPLFRDPKAIAGGTGALYQLRPTKIVAVGTNYKAHAAEMGKPIPDEPVLFLKPPSAVIGELDPIVRPRGYQRVDFEGELGLVMARQARKVPAAKALDYVLGFTCVNDVTVRDLQAKDGQWARAKGFDSFCPVGPHLVSGLDPRKLRLVTRVNGAVKQDSSTADMIFGVADLIAFISNVMTLEPGDIISTGTPSGVGPIVPGDQIEIEIEGVGVLKNPVVDEEAKK